MTNLNIFILMSRAISRKLYSGSCTFMSWEFLKGSMYLLRQPWCRFVFGCQLFFSSMVNNQHAPRPFSCLSTRSLSQFARLDTAARGTRLFCSLLPLLFFSPLFHRFDFSCRTRSENSVRNRNRPEIGSENAFRLPTPLPNRRPLCCSSGRSSAQIGGKYRAFETGGRTTCHGDSSKKLRVEGWSEGEGRGGGSMEDVLGLVDRSVDSWDERERRAERERESEWKATTKERICNERERRVLTNAWQRNESDQCELIRKERKKHKQISGVCQARVEM